MQPSAPATLQPVIRAVIDHYANLAIGGKSVPTPYFMNESGKRVRRVLGGKGSPEELEAETIRLARRYSFDLAAASPAQIRAFMIEYGLGIDCSGLVAWALHALVMERTGRPLWYGLQFSGQPLRTRLIRHLRPMENISVAILTSHANSQAISDLQEVRPSDIIRSLYGHHVLLITEVGYDKSGVVSYLKYVNSTEYAGEKHGILEGTVTVESPHGHILQQKWTGAEWIRPN